MSTINVDAFVPLREMQKQLQNLFPNDNSFRWFIRNNQPGLAANGAMISIAGRLMFHPEIFRDYVLAEGRRRITGSAA